jgi:hypothetical protein
MLRKWVPHVEYQQKLVQKMSYHHVIQGSRVAALDKSILKLYLLDLDPLLPVVKPLYPGLGRPALNQQGIIRSLVLMLDQQEHSITKWALKIGSDPLLFDLCGFDTDYAPALASYYDLLVRLWIADYSSQLRKKARLKRFISRPKKKLKANQKLPPKRPGVVKRLVNRAIKGKINSSGPQDVLQKLLARVVVDTSAKMGILGNLENFSVAFDGSTFLSGASAYGVKKCKCRSKRIYNCDCPRLFSDPDARWGWDSYRERYFYGDTLFNVTASDSPYDLPILIKLVQANRHDSATTVYALTDIFRLFPDLRFKSFLADGAMDNYPTYELLKHLKMVPFIALDARTKAKLSYPHPDVVSFDEQKRPVCKGEKPFAYWGFCQPHRLKYRCWYKAKGLEPPEKCRCSDSNYGKTIYLKTEHDPRMFTPIPRHSQAFKDKFKTRTSVERTNKRIFEDYAIEDYGARSTMIRTALATFAAVNMHLDVWVKHSGFKSSELLKISAA